MVRSPGHPILLSPVACLLNSPTPPSTLASPFSSVILTCTCRIIVGVKYCFRYNARNRARLANEDGEPMPLENMPRPHRRRREKKLMTMDEVNEKFPMTKYKTWVIERAREGLPTAGGVAGSRANSLRDADGAIEPVVSKERASTDETQANTSKEEASGTDPQPASAEGEPKADADTAKPAESAEEGAQTSEAAAANKSELQRVQSEDDLDDDDEHITAALPPEMLAAPGDSCAICIDSLEDDDDVRGLTCGHAFHAVCVDPWLTSRRACCPLCKADYYTPKPRPNQDGDASGQQGGSLDPRNNTRLNMPAPFTAAWFRSARPRLSPSTPAASYGFRSSRRTGRTNSANAATGENNQPQQTETTESTNPTQGMMSSVRSALRFGRRNNEQPAPASGESGNAAPAPEVTPAQLEAGTRTT